VNARSMPDVNCQYCMAVILLDGGKLTFEATHTYERMQDPRIVELVSKINLVGDPSFADLERQRPATVRITTNGQVHEQHVPAVRGTVDNPMTREEVEEKALDLLTSVYGTERAGATVKAFLSLEAARVRGLRPLLNE